MTNVMAEGLASAGGTRWYDLRDEASGAVRRVFVWLPPGDAPQAGWPALMMTDGNAVIGTAVDAMRAQAFYPSGTNIGWGVLIAVGYPTEDAYDPFRRSWDLGPPPGSSYPPFWPDTPEVRTGGGAEMARFLLDQVRPFVAGLAPLDPARQGLFGHSFGGLFALWLLFTRPEAFSHVIAASSAITWEDSFLLDHLAAFDPQGRRLRVHLSAGEWEGDHLAPFQEGAADAATRLADKAKTRTLAAAQEMAVALARHPGVSAQYETYAGETHMSVLPVAVNRAIQTVFALR
ncbi:prolyl oligopeptidase family serine peptidase [Gemmobacter fulvus]|uniref:Prolyl oligopeptidase family serine peptidase n=1 Tax=Gemmobacter fulvus TaxID=2840474 RepID=A0A975P3U4_9RHOB|nr:alpha/beta hydrolase-fold protein [Gemmobacter fulvus]MBT9246737.1 prolyl oligopeptidase family serine peptidase [Gemmobacter fulvus]QWK89159.1 prolyl oligopeptidase family serine peptidase [Gemmobacter fulvus]